MNRDNQQRILWIEERSTTIESIAKKKDLSEEVSRVHHKYDGNGWLLLHGNSEEDEDIV